jgi:hypothetical protein
MDIVKVEQLDMENEIFPTVSSKTMNSMLSKNYKKKFSKKYKREYSNKISNTGIQIVGNTTVSNSKKLNKDVQTKKFIHKITNYQNVSSTSLKKPGTLFYIKFGNK